MFTYLKNRLYLRSNKEKEELLHRIVAGRSIMKKLTVLLCTLALSVCVMACGNNAEENQTNEQGNANVENSTGETAGDATTEDATQNDASGDTTTGNTTEGNNSNAGDSVSNGDSVSAGDSSTTNIATIKQAVVDELGENYWPNTEMPAEFLEGYGLTSDMYNTFFGEMPMISTNVDTFIVIEAKDGKVEDVEGVLNAYREALVNDTFQYPMNVGKIQASRIATFGNYVCFVQLGADVTAVLEEGDEAVIKHCQAQNELALEAIGKVAGF